MAFSSVVTDVVVIGNRRLAFGTFTNGAATDSGGDVTTGLKYVSWFVPLFTSHLGSEAPKVTLNSASAGKVNIVTSDAVDGNWIAMGI